MRAGQLRNRVVVESSTDTPDGQGGTTRAWGTLATVWASVTSQGGREFRVALQTRATLTDEVRMRYRADVRQGMRLVVGENVTRVLTIAQPPIDVDNRHREMICLCEEIAGDVAP